MVLWHCYNYFNIKHKDVIYEFEGKILTLSIKNIRNIFLPSSVMDPFHISRFFRRECCHSWVNFYSSKWRLKYFFFVFLFDQIAKEKLNSVFTTFCRIAGFTKLEKLGFVGWLFWTEWKQCLWILSRKVFYSANRQTAKVQHICLYLTTKTTIWMRLNGSSFLRHQTPAGGRHK